LPCTYLVGFLAQKNQIYPASASKDPCPALESSNPEVDAPHYLLPST